MQPGPASLLVPSNVSPTGWDKLVVRRASMTAVRRWEKGAIRTDPQLESTAALIGRVRTGDELAREVLVARYLPVLRRWAHGRLPGHARSLFETGDLVQITLVRALDRLGTFEPRGEGAFLAYLRHTLMNQIRNEIKRSTQARAREVAAVGSSPGPSPLEEMVGRSVIDQYEAALQSLPERMQEAVILSLELQFSHKQVAEAIGCPSANAARMVVSRALSRLAQALEPEL